MNASKAHKLLRTWDDPVLKQVCAPVAEGERLDFLDTMEKVCRKAPGVGLAAPQIGVAKRVIFTLCKNARGTIAGRFMLNPEIIEKSEDTNVAVEGCLSYPGVQKRIARHNAITVRYEDIARNLHTRRFVDFEARVIQHECDHLDGICRVGDGSTTEPEPKSNHSLAFAAVATIAIAGAYR